MFRILWNSVRVPFFDPLVCPKRGGMMKVIAFLADYAAVDRIINHLNLTLRKTSVFHE